MCLYMHTQRLFSGVRTLLKTALTSSQLMELKHLGKTHGKHAKGNYSLHSCRVPKVQSRSMM